LRLETAPTMPHMFEISSNRWSMVERFHQNFRLIFILS